MPALPLGAMRKATRRSKRELFDHLVGASEKRRWHVAAEDPSRLQVDAQLELCRLYNRQTCWARALEDAARINADLVVLHSDFDGLNPGGRAAVQQCPRSWSKSQNHCAKVLAVSLGAAGAVANLIKPPA